MPILLKDFVMSPVQLASTDTAIQHCFAALKKLRPKLNAADFLTTVKAMQTEGYQLAYIAGANDALAVAGFRISHNLFMGKNLYIDDLITLPTERSQGHGETLIRFLRKLAIEQGCTTLHLDSGTHRRQAHKFYFRQGFTIASYHFSEDLT